MIERNDNISQSSNDQRSANKQRNFRFDIYYCVALLLSFSIIISYAISGMFAKYTTGASGSDSARVATYYFDINNKGEQSFTLELPNRNYPAEGGGESYWLEFDVSNGGRSEVAIKYTITIESMGNIPFVCEFKYWYDGITTKYSDVNRDENGNTVGTLAKGLPKSGGTTTVAGTMPAGILADHNYVLDLHRSSDDEARSYFYSEEIDYVTIRINAEQID